MSYFNEYPIDQSSWSFRPALPYDNEKYARFWPLYPRGKDPSPEEAYVFARQCSGIKLAPSSLFIHSNSSMLLRRLRDTANENNSVENLLANWFSGQAKPPAKSKFSRDVRRKIGDAISGRNQEIRSYAYRPFLNLYALISEQVLKELSNEGGGGTRYRPEIIAAYENPRTIGISVSPAPKDIDAKLNRFASFCWAIPDNDLSARGNGRIFCNLFPEYSKKNNWNKTAVPNINPRLIEALSAAATSPVSLEDVVFYVYGVLCSNSYLDAFEGALFTVVDTEQRPRIPFPASLELFMNIANLGKQLAELEKPDAVVDPNERGTEINSLALSFTRPFKLGSFEVKPETESIKLYDENHHLTVEMPSISPEVLSFRVSGYDVINTWLKFHSWAYTRADFTKQDFNQLLDLLYKIKSQMDIINELDAELSKILSENSPLLDFGGF